MKIVVINLLLIITLVAACGKKSETMSNEEKISGQSEKTWNATRETTASGEKDKLTKEEKKETITFSRNGNVKMSDKNQVMDGTWSFSDNTLSLQFTGSNVKENFKVTELTDDKMQLIAADGSQLTLESD